jgi:hypothetical protein
MFCFLVENLVNGNFHTIANFNICHNKPFLSVSRLWKLTFKHCLA